MICPHCKNEVQEGTFCSACGNPLEESLKLETVDELPKTYLVWSILATIFFCTLPGIAAIIFSVRVTTNLNAGFYEHAKRCSRRAKIWCIISVVLGILHIAFRLVMLYVNSQNGSAGADYPYNGSW